MLSPLEWQLQTADCALLETEDLTGPEPLKLHNTLWAMETTFRKFSVATKAPLLNVTYKIELSLGPCR